MILQKIAQKTQICITKWIQETANKNTNKYITSIEENSKHHTHIHSHTIITILPRFED